MSHPLDVTDVAQRVAAALEQAGVEYALGGSVASSLQGEPRSTNDIDFAVKLDEAQVAPLIAALGSDFSVDAEALRDAVRQRRSANIFFLPLVTKVDFFVRGHAPFDASEFSRRQKVSLRPDRPPILVASVEDNLLRKLTWFRLGNEVSDQQWRDVIGLVRIAGKAFDRSYLAHWATELGVSDLLARALAPMG